ncbi:MAG: hypothetical protein AAGA99_21245 [Actinomycetota bacterium]
MTPRGLGGCGSVELDSERAVGLVAGGSAVVGAEGAAQRELTDDLAGVDRADRSADVPAVGELDADEGAVGLHTPGDGGLAAVGQADAPDDEDEGDDEAEQQAEVPLVRRAEGHAGSPAIVSTISIEDAMKSARS